MELSYYEWHLPEAMLALAQSDKQRLGEDWKKRRGREFREAFIAAHFARFRDAEAVMLIEANGTKPTPDFAIRLQSTELWFETTEIDRPGRQRGNEPPLKEVMPVPEDEWTSAGDYLEVLRARSSSKAKKNYSKCDGLVIYANAWPLVDPEAITLDWWQSGTVDARTVFQEVWAFDGREFFAIHCLPHTLIGIST